MQQGGRSVLREVGRGARPLVEIRNVREAVALLDKWIEAARERLREIERQRDELFWSNHRANVEYFRAELYRSQLRMAGITPADEVGRE